MNKQVSVFDSSYTDNCPASSKEFNAMSDAKAAYWCKDGCSVDCTKLFKEKLNKSKK